MSICLIIMLIYYAVVYTRPYPYIQQQCNFTLCICTTGYILRSRPQSRAKFKIAPCPYVNVNNRVYIVAILDENARGRSSNSGWKTLKWNESEKFIFHVKIIDVKINGEEKNFKLSNFSFIILLFFACHRIILF